MLTSDIYEQGDIIWLNCDPQSGHEQKGRRPVMVVSNDAFNISRNFVVICPITNTDRNDPYQVPLDERTQTTGVVLTDQVRSLDVTSRDPEYIEKAPDDITAEVRDLIAGITEAL